MTVIKPEMISDKVIRKDLLPLSFLKKSAYTGSKRKMNYKLEKTEIMPETEERQPEQNPNPEQKPSPEQKSIPVQEQKPEQKPITVLRVYAWKGPLSFDNTDPGQMLSTDVEFSDAGIDAAIEYLNGLLPELTD